MSEDALTVEGGRTAAVRRAAVVAAPGHEPWRHAAVEFLLMVVQMFVVVSAVRWLLDPESPLFIADLHLALAAVGALVAVLLAALILSPPGRRSGAHLNPAVTLVLWLLRVFPGRSVLPYVLAQLAGTVAGTALARLVWGPVLGTRALSDGLAQPSPGRAVAAVFVLEAAAFAAVTLLIGLYLVRPDLARSLPYAIGVAVGLIIALLGPVSGGAANPARQLGPALVSGNTVALWAYLTGPLAGGLVGALALRYALARRAARS
ncbi:MIP/aquaporin family protein [Streptomyces sp. NPDC059070]|uniref:MIP/aquaporin family protein n=1 Tax=Streptomyces sp. NPDC059070 TaxID=3346713 RepID=UPI00368848BE